MAFDIGDWAVDQDASAATGALKRIRDIMESTLDQPAGAPDWIRKAGNGDFVKAIVQGLWEEVQANAEVAGDDSNGDSLDPATTSIT